VMEVFGESLDGLEDGERSMKGGGLDVYLHFYGIEHRGKAGEEVWVYQWLYCLRQYQGIASFTSTLESRAAICSGFRNGRLPMALYVGL